jgi:small subunit ribosomal protein S13
MPRIMGIDIPNEKKIFVSLTYIYGIGRALAFKILREAGVDAEKRSSQLSLEELQRIANVIEKGYKVEGVLRRQVTENIVRLRKIQCYRGIRHAKGLPVRGQRTRTNARTRKGKRKTVAGKKGVKEVHG